MVISLLGKIVGRDLNIDFVNPLKTIDNILETEKDTTKIAVIVNFHGDYSSEKVVIGHYLDGVATAVIGDHWHVPSNDARILPNKTAHISDVGMNGSLNSSLGVKLNIAISRWRNKTKLKNELIEEDNLQFNAVLVEFDTNNVLANSIKQIRVTS